MSSTISTPGASTGADRRPPRGAFTLFELLVSIVVIAGVAALVVPSLLNILDDAAYDAAGEVLTSQMLLARAAAQESGRPVEVVYAAADRAVIARWFDPARAAEEARSGASPNAFATRRGMSGVPVDATTITEPWAARPLAGNATLTGERPAALDPDPLGFEREAPAPPAGFGPTEPPLRIAVYLPDGSVLVSRDVWLVDEGERMAALAVNAMTGQPKLERLEVPALDARAGLLDSPDAAP